MNIYTHIIYWRIACAIDESMQRNNYILGIKSYAPYAAHSTQLSCCPQITLSAIVDCRFYANSQSNFHTHAHTDTHTKAYSNLAFLFVQCTHLLRQSYVMIPMP